jgi:hypothetical protein
MRLVFPEPGGPVMKMTGREQACSRRLKSRFLGNIPAGLGQVIFAKAFIL